MFTASGSLHWFLKLRWFAFFGQAAVLLAAKLLFSLSLPYLSLAVLLLAIPLTNVVTASFFGDLENERPIVGTLLVLDTLLLTALLCLAGGPTNPFSIVYLLHVALSAVMLGARWTWAMAILSSVCFAALFRFSLPVPQWQHHEMHDGFSLHLQGMLLSYAVTALSVAYFLTKIIAELVAQQARVGRLELLAAKQQRLASLTALSAGAAHELGTPLGTILLVAHELERNANTAGLDPVVAEDLRLLKNQAERCREIIQGLALHGGELSGEMPQEFLLADLIADVLGELGVRGAQVKCEIDPAVSAQLLLPRRALRQACVGLLKNALDATAAAQSEVLFAACVRAGRLQILILDQGPGMSVETLARLGEPFFTTKAYGRGMGLGLYLAKLVAELLGGGLRVDSQLGRGTRVEMEIPARIEQGRKIA